ncbi:MAG: hypothetical protein WBZ57_00210 [Pseudomonas graminis]
MAKKLLDFQANISDVKQVNPLFSTCKVRVLYTGRNRNMSIITKDAVEKALPTLKNIPIVGEFSETNNDYKGHGGAIDLDSYKYIHTTKPYGVVPESATYEWEDVKGADGAIRQYLTIDGCYLWTGRYEEAFSVVEKGKGQSMEIEVTDGRWDESQEAYQIDNFIFSALCILGDDVEPAFEDANITAYSLDKDSFKQEFTAMLSELKSSLEEKEVNAMLKELLAKYSVTMEDLTAKGLDFSEISEEELEAKIIEALEIEVEIEEEVVVETEVVEEEIVSELADVELEVEIETEVEETEVEIETEVTDAEVVVEEEVEEEAVVTVDVEALQSRITELEGQLEELDSLREFKLNVEKADHEAKAQKLFNDFQLTVEDTEGLDVHKFSVEEIEEKCYAILGRKMAKKNFSKNKEDEGNIRLPLGNEGNQEESPKPYGGLFEKYNKQ